MYAVRSSVLCYLFVVASLATLAQNLPFGSTSTVPANLVPNSSFEDIPNPPCIWCQDPVSYWEKIPHWSSPTETTPDIFHTGTRPDCYTNPKKHNGGKQFPHSGAAMAGIKTYGKGGTDTFWHEYLMCTLDSPLVPGVNYYAEFWVAHSARSERYTNNLGLVVSDTAISTRNRMPLFITPQINEDEIVKTGTFTKWKKIAGVFTAETAANYLLIGNFYDDKYTNHVKLPEGEGGGYYYVDDIVLRRALPGEKPTAKPKRSIAPAPKIVLPRNEVASTIEIKLDSVEFKTGNVIRLENIFFEFDKAVLLPESQKELNKLHDLMYDYPYLKIEIRGHTDNVGSDAYNQNLSESRARAVVEYLTKKGIEDKRLRYSGYGSSRPAVSNDSEEGRKFNRRVEFVILED